MAEESSIFDDLEDPGGIGYSTGDGAFLGTFEDIAAADAAGGIDWSKLVDSAGKIDWGKLLTGGAGVAAGIRGLTGGGGGSQKPTGYQGKVPSLTAVREQLPMPVTDPARRPGSAGRRYFTDTQYIPRTAGSSPTAPATTPAGSTLPPATNPVYNPVQDNVSAPAQQDSSNSGGAAQGGLIGLARGGMAAQPRFLAGGTDGMADKIPATIEGNQPAKLGHGEFVIPADVVGFLGSGNSEAGAKVLYAMMDRVRKHAHGSKKQIKPANLKKTLPA